MIDNIIVCLYANQSTNIDISCDLSWSTVSYDILQTDFFFFYFRLSYQFANESQNVIYNIPKYNNKYINISLDFIINDNVMA